MKEVWKKIWSYLNFFKKQPAPSEEGTNFNLKAMHMINKISILMFIIAVIVLIVRFSTR